VPSAFKGCENCTAGAPLRAGGVWLPSLFISRKFRQEIAAVAEQKLSPALIHGNRVQLCHFPSNKADREKFPEKKK
jgi:hypothetical protein